LYKFSSVARRQFATTKGAVHQRRLARRAAHPRPHKPFRRSYREDYARGFRLPGLLHHAVRSLRVLWRHKKLFSPLLVGAVIINMILVGLMSEDTYTTLQDTLDETNESLASGRLGSVAKAGLLLVSTVTTGGLTGGMTEVQTIFVILIFLTVWLTTIYLTRQIKAGHRPKLRDALYNALGPFISTFIVLIVTIIFLIPIFILIITYSAAVTTGFLATPFYAFCFFVFALLLILLSGYLLPGALMALVATTTPGIYPFTAINLSFDLVVSRRIRLFIRIIFFFIFLALIWVAVMLPIILLDMWMKSSLEIFTGLPLVPSFLALMTVFSFVYFAVYFYLIYRHLLDDPN
jgi:hypothetical protein